VHIGLQRQPALLGDRLVEFRHVAQQRRHVEGLAVLAARGARLDPRD